METIVSKYKFWYTVGLWIYPIIWILIIYTSISYSFSHYGYNSQQIFYLSLLLIALISIKAYEIWKGIVGTVIITRENITVKYIITNQKVIILHTDIKAIYNTSGSQSRSSSQELELNNGKLIAFSESMYANYSELKAALWEYRLLAYAELREKEAKQENLI